MKIISWNVNGIRAAVKNGFGNFLKEAQPDILGLQEIKIAHDDIKKLSLKFSAQGGPASGWDFAGYDEYWNPAERPGYSGTATLAKIKPLNYSQGFSAPGGPALDGDEEGRVQTLEFEKFYFVNCYFPNANHELSRLDFKEEFNEKFLKYIKKLEKTKPVITCGDFNVAHQEIDLARPKENVGNAGFTKEERAWADKFVQEGLVDTFRLFNREKVQYSWWSYRNYARERNVGWRIDYFMVSQKLLPQIKKAFILDEVIGSDHCPVGIEIEI